MKRILGLVALFALTAQAQVDLNNNRPDPQVKGIAQTASGGTGSATGFGYTPRTTGTSLTLTLIPGKAYCAGSPAVAVYGGGTLTMTASATNYVYLNTAASCVPAVKTTAFISTDIPIAVVTTSGSAITAIVDQRTAFGVAGSGGGAGACTGSSTTDINCVTSAKFTASSGSGTDSLTLDPANGAELYDNTDSGLAIISNGTGNMQISNLNENIDISAGNAINIDAATGLDMFGLNGVLIQTGFPHTNAEIVMTGGSTNTINLVSVGGAPNVQANGSPICTVADPCGGGGTPATPFGSPQFNQAGSFAAQGQVFYQQTGDTISSIETECSSLCTYVVSTPQTITLAGDHTLSANVQLDFKAGGLWTLAGGHTLTIPGNASGTLNKHFAGSAVSFGASNSVIPVEWFGAVGDGATDDQPYIQKALDAVTNGQILLQAKTYAIASQLDIHRNTVGIRGTAINAILLSTTAGANGVVVSGTDIAHPIYANRFDLFSIQKSGTPTGTATGMLFNYAVITITHEVSPANFIRQFYFHSGGGNKVYDSNTAANAGQYGYYLDSADGLGEQSLYIFNGGTNCSGGSGNYGFYVFGSAINDVDLINDFTGGCDHGMYVEYTGSGAVDSTADFHIINEQIDAAQIDGIVVKNVQPGTGAVSSTINISDGYSNCGGTTCKNFWIINSKGVTVNHVQVGNANDGGILYLADSSSNLAVSNLSSLEMASSGIALLNTTNSVVMGNTINSRTPPSQFVLANLGTSNYNSFIGNSISGTGIGMQTDSDAQIGNVGLYAPNDLNNFASTLSAAATSCNGHPCGVYTVATLPSASAWGIGQQFLVTDSTGATTCTGGGSLTSVAVSNGTTWSCGSGGGGGGFPIAGTGISITNPSSGVVDLGAAATVTNAGAYTGASFNALPLSRDAAHQNVALGSGTGTSSGTINTLLGDSTGAALTTGASNTAVGAGALANVTTGGNNTALGYNAGQGTGLTTLSGDTFIGESATTTSGSLANSIVIGYNASGSADNTAYLGNSSVTAGYIGSHQICQSNGTGCPTTTTRLSCQPGVGDGLNAIPAGTYLQTTCRNETGSTWTLTGISCVADAGSSTCNVTNGAGTALLTGAVTGTPTYASGTQSGTTTIAAGDYLKITFVADGTSKQIGIDVTGTY